MNILLDMLDMCLNDEDEQSPLLYPGDFLHKRSCLSKKLVLLVNYFVNSSNNSLGSNTQSFSSKILSLE